MEVKIVLGHLFGDEGKGVTTQWLCKKAIDEGKKPIVIRFSGGPQAGHTINLDGIEHICSSYGSGSLLGVPTIIMDYFDPICAYKEFEILSRKVENVPQLYLTHKTKLITPYDVISGINNEKVLKDGTCGKGIFPTFKRYKDCKDWYAMSLEEEVQATQSYYSSNLDVMEDVVESWNTLNLKFVHLNLFSHYDVIIFEGSQGLLLDMDNGFFPNVTPAKVGLNGIDPKYLKDAEVYLVTRTYLTRHGNGYIPKYSMMWDLSNKRETNINNKFQGEFKIGMMEPEMLQLAFQRHCLDNYKTMYNCSFNLVITHTDVIPNDEPIKDIIKVYPSKFLTNIYTNDSTKSNLKLWK